MTVSVIIPVLNEESVLEKTLSALQEQGPHEVIIVDGGSSDRSRDIAGRYGTVVESSRGRAAQMNEGARQAAGDLLLFLHADTVLPPGALASIQKAVREGAGAGRFRMRFDHESILLRLYASYTSFQFFSYGDQAFFVRRCLFEAMKGFDPEAPFEDIEFYRRLLRRTRPVILRETVTTSARRFLKVGSLRQKWINLFLVCLYYAGFDAAAAAAKSRFYRDVR